MCFSPMPAQFGKWVLIGLNCSLASSLLHYELKCLGWVGVWWWRFGVEWVILIFLMTIDWCGYSLVCTPFAGLTGADDLSEARGLSKECMAE